MSFKERVLDNQRRHGAFRRSYWKNQTKYISYMSLAAVIASLILAFTVVPIWHKNNITAGFVKYGFAFFIDLVAFIWSRYLLSTNKLTEEVKAKHAEILCLMLGISYLSWGVMSMDITFHESGMLDEFPFFIALAILTAFFFFPGHHYMAVVLVGIIGFSSVLLSHKFLLTPIRVVETSITLLLLFRLGQNHYIFARNTFESERQNKELIEETEASNTELVSINSELTSTTAKLEEALAKVQASVDYQKAFSANLSHDMRAPLNGIIGTVQVMLMNEGLTEEQKEDLETCMTSSKTLLALVNDVLDYSKIEAGQMEILPVDFDLHEVINAVNGMFKVQAEKKGLVFKLEVDDNTPCNLYADDFRIQQVMTNIVSNAVKYTECGGVTLKVDVSEAGMLTFVVADTGQGMSQESLKDLFVPFKRINEKNNKRIQGTGLGMAIVQYTVEKMNGTIEVESVEGEGSTFTISIPVKIRNWNRTWKNFSKEKVVEKVQHFDFAGKRILYIDDTAVNLRIVSKMLSGTGAKVEITPSPLEGIKYLRTKKYDMLLVDHLMPDMDGEELLVKLRATECENRNIPAIILTGNSGAGIDEHYKKLGFAGYLTKPIMRNDLLGLIRQTFDKQG